jgi:hypothetical protein
MSQDIGLHVDPTSWGIPVVDRHRRIRVWWMVYIQDRWAALGLGRPSYLSTVPLPTTANISCASYQDLPSPASGVSQFIGMAKLTTILSDILSTFYSLRASERLKLHTPRWIYDLMGKFEHRLQSFYDEHLSKLLDIDTFLDPTGKLPHFHIGRCRLTESRTRHDLPRLPHSRDLSMSRHLAQHRTKHSRA